MNTEDFSAWENLPWPVVVCDGDGLLAFRNHLARAIGGAGAARRIEQLLPIGAEVWASWVQRILAGERLEQDVKGPASTTLRVTCWLAGDTAEAIGVAWTDVSPERRAAAKVATDAERMEGMLNLARDGALDIQWDRGVLWSNEAFARLFGTAAGAKPIPEGSKQEVERIHPEDRPDIISQFLKAAAEGRESIEFEHRLVDDSGEIRWVKTLATLVGPLTGGRPARLSGWVTDITQQKRLQAAFKAILATESSERGTEFFQRFVCALTNALQVRYGMVGEIVPGTRRVRVLAFAERDKVRPSFEYDLDGTPCETVLHSGMCFYPDGVQQSFPRDLGLVTLGAVSYLGVLLRNPQGEGFGLISVMDDRPLPDSTVSSTVLTLFATRAAAEMERVKAEASRADSERSYRELFNNMLSGLAIVETVKDDSGRTVDMRYIDVNPAFERALGIGRDQAIGSTMRTAFPGIEDIWIEQLAAVADLRQHVYFEHFSRNMQRYYELRAFPTEPGRACFLFYDVTDRRRAEEVVRESARLLQSFLENVLLATVILDPDGRVLFCNDFALELMGYRREEIIGQDWFAKVVPEEESAAILDRARGGGWKAFPRHWQNHIRTSRGHLHLMDWDVTPLSKPDGSCYAIAAIGRDLTAWKRIEEEYQTAQRMEAVGRLAGSVAHDFNNLLTVINGHGRLAMVRTDPEHPARHHTEEIIKAGEHAAELTKQLLAFSRRQFLKPQRVDLNESVRGIESILTRLLGDTVLLELQLDPDVWPVRADPGQVSQVLVNLAVNARDAMEGTGRLLVRTSNLRVDEAFCAQHPSAKAGDYVRLTVADTGKGIDAETLPHLFEPFFTTKEPGRGTGLGLATVYGIVRQSGGFVLVQSAPASGASFLIFLPRLVPGANEQDAAVGLAVEAGTATILLVEDQPEVLRFVAEVLRERGYQVLEAATAAEATECCSNLNRRVDLLLSDIVMPGMHGPDLAARARALRPGLRVLLMSGYPQDVLREHTSGLVQQYLQKPFSPDQLITAVRRALQS